jgi:hypothetical protein
LIHNFQLVDSKFSPWSQRRQPWSVIFSVKVNLDFSFLVLCVFLNQANASAKRTAQQNELALRNLKIWMLVAPFTALFLRFFFRSSLFPSKMSSFIHVLTFIPLFVLYTHLNSIGSPRRDPTTGALIGSGEDLNMSGVTEWCWDIIYVTWACQIGSAVLGEWFWWTYLCVSVFFT